MLLHLLRARVIEDRAAAARAVLAVAKHVVREADARPPQNPRLIYAKPSHAIVAGGHAAGAGLPRQ